MGRKIRIGLAGIAVAALGMLIWRLDIPNWQKLDLNRLTAQPVSTIVCDASGESMGTFARAGTRLWTPLSGIPQHVRNAFIAAEDQRFYEHGGISIRRILGALLSNIRTQSYSQGASTITQQLIKLTHLSGTKTLSRKAQEAFLALQLERRLTKDEILESYLNTIYFGSGAYGVESAAMIYFGKDAASVTVPEAALLAAIIKAPSNYAPHINPEKALSRRNLVLREMEECGFITDLQLTQALNEPIRLAMDKDADAHSGWFMDAVFEEASSLLSMSVDDVLSSGYIIRTAFEPDIQSAADALFADSTNFPVDAADGTPVQAALVAMRPDSGEICAIVGGRTYEVQRGLNRATQISRSPGSAIKPVSTYAAAIDAHGFSPSSMIEDTPREFSGGYRPGNAGGNTYGTVTLREALSRSLNIATVDLADLIGMNAVRNYASRFGLNPALQDNNLALSLGSMTYGVSPAELCAAYSALANGGRRVKPHLIARIDDSHGKVIYQAELPSGRAVQDSTACMIIDMLRTAADSGSARALAAAGIPVAGKTGTVSDADGSTRDIWTAACTPDLALTVWMGFDAPDDAHRLASTEGGSGYPARLCASLLKSCRQALSGADFSQPPSVRTALLDRLALENDEVRLATAQTPSDYIIPELFRESEIPQVFSDNWTAPEPIGDLTLLSGSGETPVLQFTARDETAEYLLLRSNDDVSDVAAVLTGSEGEVLRFADEEADLSENLSYTVLPRHRLLRERGTLLTGKESAAVAYSPGSVMSLLFGPGEDHSTPEPADIELNKSQSLFG